MSEGVQLRLARMKDLVRKNLWYHNGLLELKDVEYTETESYPTAAMLSSVMIPIQNTGYIGKG